MIIVGHRGARGEAPENTLSGFRHAIDRGVRHFEFDVRITRDGELVCLHDVNLKRTTGHNQKIHHINYDTLADIDASFTKPWHEKTAVTSIRNIFIACPEIESVQLEVKTTRAQRLKLICNKLVTLIDELSLQQKVVVTSFDSRVIRFMADLAPHIRRGLIAEKSYLRPAHRAIAMDCHFLCLHWKIATPERIHLAQKHGMHVSTWTVNDFAIADLALSYGIDSLITDYPTRFLPFYS